MWLIDVADYSLVEVSHPEDHQYAILSHTWGRDGEVTFDDMKSLPVAMEKPAWRKIAETCTRARIHELPYAWIDTCCIDKRSSAELTEAINSMFRWYKLASICFTYLSDLSPSPGGGYTSQRAMEQLQADLGLCRWFARGWTLQELIASKRIEFYDSTWSYRGTKASLSFLISTITEIDMSVLADSDEMSLLPVARRMSWAANRKTTRIEDVAYCLFGIFDVNMPLIYGEGAKAFTRLQEAIAQSSNDLSLFAWSEDERNPHLQDFYGIFASSPQQFAKCRQLERLSDPLMHHRQGFTLTNRGVEFRTRLVKNVADHDYMMELYCKDAKVDRAEGKHESVAIRLVKTATGFARHRAATVFLRSESEATVDPLGPFMPVHVPNLISAAESLRLSDYLTDTIRIILSGEEAFRDGPFAAQTVGTFHRGQPQFGEDAEEWRQPPYWDSAGGRFLTGGYGHFTGLLFISISTIQEPLIILCGLVPDTDLPPNQRAPPRPWALLHARSSWKSSSTSNLRYNMIDMDEIFSLSSKLPYPQFLSQAGRAVRAALFKGTRLPDYAEVETPGLRYIQAHISCSTKTPENRRHRVNVYLKEVPKPALQR